MLHARRYWTFLSFRHSNLEVRAHPVLGRSVLRSSLVDLLKLCLAQLVLTSLVFGKGVEVLCQTLRLARSGHDNAGGALVGPAKQNTGGCLARVREGDRFESSGQRW